MKQYKITAADFKEEIIPDCGLDPDDPIHELFDQGIEVKRHPEDSIIPPLNIGEIDD